MIPIRGTERGPRPPASWRESERDETAAATRDGDRRRRDARRRARIDYRAVARSKRRGRAARRRGRATATPRRPDRRGAARSIDRTSRADGGKATPATARPRPGDRAATAAVARFRPRDRATAREKNASRRNRAKTKAARRARGRAARVRVARRRAIDPQTPVPRTPRGAGESAIETHPKSAMAMSRTLYSRPLTVSTTHIAEGAAIFVEVCCVLRRERAVRKGATRSGETSFVRRRGVCAFLSLGMADAAVRRGGRPTAWPKKVMGSVFWRRLDSSRTDSFFSRTRRGLPTRGSSARTRSRRGSSARPSAAASRPSPRAASRASPWRGKTTPEGRTPPRTPRSPSSPRSRSHWFPYDRVGVVNADP